MLPNTTARSCRLAVPRYGLWIKVVIGLVFATGFALGNLSTIQANDPIINGQGYRDFSYQDTSTDVCNTRPTGEKPESKLWYADNFWWAVMCDENSTTAEYRIYRLDLASHTWISGPLVEQHTGNIRKSVDVLWDEANDSLYVVSHRFVNTGSTESSSDRRGRLYRFSYTAGNPGTYTLDSNFPVTVNDSSSETLTLAKDTTGQLWVTYTRADNSQNKVWVNRTVPCGDLGRSGDDPDTCWGTPFVITSDLKADVQGDDISAILAFDGYTGVMWSNQDTDTMYFAVHTDTDTVDQNWTIVSAYGGAGTKSADDHINLKTDGAGNVYAAAKTSKTGSSDPLLVLLVCKTPPCDSSGNWTAYTIDTEQYNHTRPILLIELVGTQAKYLHVFGTSSGGGGTIFHKVSDVDPIAFSNGPGTPFIEDPNNNINNATSTKQNVNSTTDLVVLASSHAGSSTFPKYYFHNYEDLTATAIDLLSFTAGAGIDGVTVNWETGTEVDNAGFNLYRATAIAGPYTKINDRLIPARGNPVSGASYVYLDTTAGDGVVYYYKLEDIDFNGVSTFHGPVSTASGISGGPPPGLQIYLPLIFK